MFSHFYTADDDKSPLSRVLGHRVLEAKTEKQSHNEIDQDGTRQDSAKTEPRQQRIRKLVGACSADGWSSYCPLSRVIGYAVRTRLFTYQCTVVLRQYCRYLMIDY